MPSDDFRLVVPRFVTMPMLHHLIDRASPLLEGDTHFRRFVVDLKELSLISPMGLATLASVLMLAVRTSRFDKGVIARPKRKHVHTYLSRMNLYKLLRLKEPRSERPHRVPARRRFRPLVEVKTADECMDVTGQLCAVLTKNVPLSDTILTNINYCLSEVLENVCQHANSPINGVACAQSYGKRQAVELAIADCGIGIRQSLAKNPQYVGQLQSHADAVRLSVQKGVTSNPGHNTGEGLFFVAELLSRSGRMRLQSGDAVLTLSRSVGSVDQAPHWPGTLVGLRFELKRGIPIRELFDKYFPQEEQDWDLFAPEETVAKE